MNLRLFSSTHGYSTQRSRPSHGRRRPPAVTLETRYIGQNPMRRRSIHGSIGTTTEKKWVSRYKLSALYGWHGSQYVCHAAEVHTEGFCLRLLVNIPALQHSLSAVDMPAVYYILCVFGQIFPSIWRNTHFLKLRTNLREHPTATLDSRLELASEKTQKSAAAVARSCKQFVSAIQ